MCTGGMNDVDAYSSLLDDVTSLRIAVEQFAAIRQQEQAAALNQHLSFSCDYCRGDHHFTNCPHNPESFCFLGSDGMHNQYSSTFNSEWKQYPSWEGQSYPTGLDQYEEPSGFETYNEPEQWQPQMQEHQQQSSLEVFVREHIARMDAHMIGMNSVTASLSLKTQMEQQRNETSPWSQEALPSTIQYAYEDEQEYWIAAKEDQKSMLHMVDEETAMLPEAVGEAHAPTCPDAWLPDESAEELQATAWPYGQAPAWVHISAPATQVAPAIACTISPLAPEDDHAPTWSVSSITSTHETLAKQEEPLPTGAEGIAEPAIVQMQLTNRSLPRPINKTTDELANKVVFPADFMILDHDSGMKATKSSAAKRALIKHLEGDIPNKTFRYSSLPGLQHEGQYIKEPIDDTRFEATVLKKKIIKKRAYSFLSPVD